MAVRDRDHRRAHERLARIRVGGRPRGEPVPPVLRLERQVHVAPARRDAAHHRHERRADFGHVAAAGRHAQGRRRPPGDDLRAATRLDRCEAVRRGGSLAVPNDRVAVGRRMQHEVVAPDEPLPKLPVARAVWKPLPDLATSAECWLTAGGPHHTVLSSAVTTEVLTDFAEMLKTELVIIDGDLPLSGHDQQKLLSLKEAGRVISFDGSTEKLVASFDRLLPMRIKTVGHHPNLRVRQVIKQGTHFYLLFNESSSPLSTKLDVADVGAFSWIDTATGEIAPATLPLRLELPGFATALLYLTPTA